MKYGLKQQRLHYYIDSSSESDKDSDNENSNSNVSSSEFTLETTRRFSGFHRTKPRKIIAMPRRRTSDSSVQRSGATCGLAMRKEGFSAHLPPLPASVAFPLKFNGARAKGAAMSSAYAKGEHYRELAERARMKLRRVSVDGIAIARASACSSFAQPIHRELEETRKFLSELSVDPAHASNIAAVAIDSAVSSTLAQIEQMRRDFECRRKEEELARKKAEEERIREEQRKKDEAAKNALEEKQKLERQAVEAKQKAAEAKNKAAAEKEAEDRAMAAAEAAAKAAQSQAKQVSPEALEWATKYRNMYRQLMDGLAMRIRENLTAKNYCVRQRGLITRGVGQLKDSMEFVNRVARTIAGIVDESAQLHGTDTQEWMLNLVAKAFVKQAEKEVSVAHHAAYPLAAAAVLLMQRYPRLIDMLLVRLIKKCPYVVPQFFPKKDGQTPDEYLRSIGYKEKDDDELESEGIYMERMAGMIALFAAVTQTQALNGQPNPLPVSYAWAWFARMLNLPPRSISPLLINAFLSIAGTSLLAAYKGQFKKAMDLLAKEWIPAIAATDPVAIAAKSNLAGFVDTYRQTGKLTECKGRVIKIA
ncbi:hypothetical protein J3B02_000974 [Coemansia erecta]|nr:hypothetical protein J3B02_000974 [Coemansia erecta]KAJ2885212.1 hypothetical protein FB639_001819 [Coemansia asiatica]